MLNLTNETKTNRRDKCLKANSWIPKPKYSVAIVKENRKQKIPIVIHYINYWKGKKMVHELLLNNDDLEINNHFLRISESVNFLSLMKRNIERDFTPKKKTRLFLYSLLDSSTTCKYLFPIQDGFITISLNPD